MAYLYQEIMNVPGLTGRWQDRNRQLYEKLGSPLGPYNAGLEHNMYLLNQIRNNDYFRGGLPGQQAPAPVQEVQQQVQQPAAPPQTIEEKTLELMRQYTDPMTGRIKEAAKIPEWYSHMGDYQDIWESRFQPGAIATGEQVIKPEMMRNYNERYGDYMRGLAQSGGGRFGRALGGVGNLKAASNRDYINTLQNWLGQQKMGIEDMWYNKAQDIWNQARTQVKPGETMVNEGIYQTPSWEEWQKKSDYFQDAYGVKGNPSLF